VMPEPTAQEMRWWQMHRSSTATYRDQMRATISALPLRDRPTFVTGLAAGWLRTQRARSRSADPGRTTLEP
jgi:hypothetical protein